MLGFSVCMQLLYMLGYSVCMQLLYMLGYSVCMQLLYMLGFSVCMQFTQQQSNSKIRYLSLVAFYGNFYKPNKQNKTELFGLQYILLNLFIKLYYLASIIHIVQSYELLFDMWIYANFQKKLKCVIVVKMRYNVICTKFVTQVLCIIFSQTCLQKR